MEKPLRVLSEKAVWRYHKPAWKTNGSFFSLPAKIKMPYANEWHALVAST
jgi:hypothetical protein